MTNGYTQWVFCRQEKKAYRRQKHERGAWAFYKYAGGGVTILYAKELFRRGPRSYNLYGSDNKITGLERIA